MKKLLRSVVLAAVPALLYSAPASAQTAALPDADPAMWVVKDKDTTIYMLGTFHALDGKTEWFNDEVKAAFDKSQEVVVEVIMPEDPAAMQGIMAKYAQDTSGKTLSSRLSPAGREKLAKRLAAMGAPATALDTLKPFFASLTLTMLEAQKLGMDGKNGADKIITEAAKKNGKKLGDLETAEFQLSMFDALPAEKQVAMLESTLDQLDEIPALFGQMKTLWNAGDAEGFAKLMQSMSAESPESYKIIFSDRNAKWAEWVDQRLDKPGTVFMAVGTGHLAGKDSVQDFLAKRGIKSARVPSN
jgi:uncharacterized protein YbaP (TraB family)